MEYKISEELLKDIIRIIAVSAREAALASLRGKSLPAHGKIDLFAFMSSPRPGDYVIEQTTTLGPHPGSEQLLPAFGRLIVCRKEYFAHTEEPGGYVDRVWHIEDMLGRHQTWRNAEFFRVPTRLISDADTSQFGPGDNCWASLAMERHGIPKDFKGVSDES